LKIEWRQAINGVSHSTFKIQPSKLGWCRLPAGCAALTCGYENPTLRVISLLLIRMNYELAGAITRLPQFIIHNS
jgi:hypothetical protein